MQKYPNQAWATDLTYIKLPSGFVNLMTIIDLYAKRVLKLIVTNTLDFMYVRRHDKPYTAEKNVLIKGRILPGRCVCFFCLAISF